MSEGKLPVPAGQGVGYRRPPVEHRFQKGQSGNPIGRPRGAKNRPKQLDPANQPTDDLILEEAYRPVTIREGERTIELPAIQAAVRALAISAMKGSRLSQRALAELVRNVEERKSSEHLTMMENALEYKQKWTAELDRRRKLGITDLPDPVPHPDDLLINMRTGHVRTEGPLDEREKKDWDRRIARRAAAQEEVNVYAEMRRKARSPKRKQMWLDELHHEQRIFDLINDAMPERYKAKLENRSWVQGASREGKTLAEYARDRKRAKGRKKAGHLVEGG
ncbi:MAG: hypothetical protein IPF97_04520 [Sphingomonadales bacterium]|nr:hypothetical protein [Sphingomonadales bacterium]MBK9589214.1 hypothetical protein [Sphingomonadales bacterium]